MQEGAVVYAAGKKKLVPWEETGWVRAGGGGIVTRNARCRRRGRRGPRYLVDSQQPNRDSELAWPYRCGCRSVSLTPDPISGTSTAAPTGWWRGRRPGSRSGGFWRRSCWKPRVRIRPCGSQKSGPLSAREMATDEVSFVQLLEGHVVVQPCQGRITTVDNRCPVLQDIFA